MRNYMIFTTWTNIKSLSEYYKNHKDSDKLYWLEAKHKQLPKILTDTLKGRKKELAELGLNVMKREGKLYKA